MNIIDQIDQEQIAKLTDGKDMPTFDPGDSVRVRVDLQHNKIGVERRSFLITLEDGAGNVLARKETDPITMSFGERIRRTYRIGIPAGTAPGEYNVRVKIAGMQQGHAMSLRRITVD